MSAGMRPRRGAECAGTTLVELVAGTVLLSAILLAAVAATHRSLDSWRETDRMTDVERRAQNGIEIVASALMPAGRATLVPLPVPPLGTDQLTFRGATGIVDGDVTWSGVQTLAWQASPADPTNGADDDRNGVVDDGVVVWRRNVGAPEESSTVLARGVPAWAPGETDNDLDDNGNGLADERGFAIWTSGSGLKVRMWLAQKLPDGTVVVKVADRAVTLRN